jgi:hypothetical protein
MRMHGQRGEIGMGTIVVLALVVGAIAAGAFVFMGRAETDAAQDDLAAIPDAQAALARSNLDAAMRGAQVYFAENATFAGYTPEVAAQVAGGPTYMVGVPAPGGVAIRGVTPTTIVFVATTPSGGSLCVAANGPTITQGTQDARTAAECSAP